MRVIARGTLRQHSYQTQDGQNRTVIDMTIDDIGPSLRYATAAVARQQTGHAGRTGNGHQNGNGYQGGYQGGATQTPPQDPHNTPETDPWSDAGGMTFGASDDYPPAQDDPEF